jgi:hypothetical protein
MSPIMRRVKNPECARCTREAVVVVQGVYLCQYHADQYADSEELKDSLMEVPKAQKIPPTIRPNWDQIGKL